MPANINLKCPKSNIFPQINILNTIQFKLCKALFAKLPSRTMFDPLQRKFYYAG